MEDIIRTKLSDLGARCEAFTAAVEVKSAAKGDRATKFKAWRDSIKPTVQTVDDLASFVNEDDEIPTADLLGLINLVDAIRENLTNYVQSNYFATLPTPVNDAPADLSAERESIVHDYKILVGMAEGGWFDFVDDPAALMAEYLPIKIGKIGKMKSEGPLLDIPKVMTDAPRSNSVLDLYVDGVKIDEDNFSTAVTKGLGVTLKDLRDGLSAFTPNVDHNFRGRTVRFVKRDK